MNIVQLHERVRFWTDTVASARFETEDIDQAINNAIHEIVDEKISHSRLNHRGDSFQNSQRIRDELKSLVKPLDTNGTLTLTKNEGYVLVSTFPSDYKYLLSISITVGDNTYNCWPLSYDRENIIEDNPFRRVRQTPNVKCYYIEDEDGIRVKHPFSKDDPDKVSIYYLANPVDVYYGVEKTPSDTIGFLIDVICASTPTTYISTNYKFGEELTTAAAVFDKITYGIAVVDFVNPNINGLLHEEIAKRAAANCLLSAGDFDKYKAFKAEVLAT